jgi:hypothetical protein
MWKDSKFSISPALFYIGFRNTNQIAGCKKIASGDLCNGIGIGFFFQLLIIEGKVKNWRGTVPDMATK